MRKYLDANIIENTKDMPKSEWLEKRRIGIGGSDASSILGFNPYRSSMAVYLDKIRYAHVANDKSVAQNCDAHVDNDKSVAQNCHSANGLKDESVAQIVEPVAQEKEVTYKMELGNKLKSFVASEFMLKSGKKVRNINGILQNDKYPFAIANIDRGVVGEKAF